MANEAPPKDDDEKRLEDVIKRLLETPPQPHKVGDGLRKKRQNSPIEPEERFPSGDKTEKTDR
jgi:hypothetical protein